MKEYRFCYYLGRNNNTLYYKTVLAHGLLSGWEYVKTTLKRQFGESYTKQIHFHSATQGENYYSKIN